MVTGPDVRRSEQRFEAVLILTVAGVSVLGVWTELRFGPQPTPPPIGAYALVAVACGVLPWRRRWPGAVAAVVLGCVYAYHLSGYPGLAVAIVCFLVVFTLAADGRRWSLVGAAVVVLLTWIAAAVPPNPQPLGSAALVGPMLGMVSAGVVGVAARQRRLAFEERERQARRAGEAELGQRVAEERLRIARELHDVLAHTVAVISVQAGVALDALDEDIEAARSALHVVRTAARQAGPELRAAVGLLRPSDGQRPADLQQPSDRQDDPQPLSDLESHSVAPPAPRLADLPDLLAAARAAGLATTVQVEPGSDPLPHPLELTAFRIVQESVTNVVRHARAGRVEVAVTREGDTLVVDVRDDGQGRTRRAGQGGSDGAATTSTTSTTVGAVGARTAGVGGTGLGVVGMRERAQLLGGTIDIGSAPGGGFRVHARLPIAGEEP